MKKSSPLTIYWAISSTEESGPRILLADIHFNSVMKDLTKRRAKSPIVPTSTRANEVASGSYHFCTALHNLADNMFYLNAPFDIDIEVNNVGQILPSKRAGWFIERGQTMDDSFNLDLDYEIHLFSEEPVEVTVTPPYLHQSSIPQYGFISSVKWDISAWFRPLVVIFQLWPGVRELRIKEGEPLVYLTFNTERPIVFKQFRQTSTIKHISSACLQHKFLFAFLPLKKMYDKFVRQGLRDDLLKEIKNNIIKETNV
jgi:hypothetical protein